ncbi:MAG: hypothetical protein ABL994_02915 [Verrucomicrobiales bacterium]
MKSLILAALLFCSLLSPLAAAPALSAADAAAIAQADLVARGLDATVYIAQILFKKGGLGAPEHWEVLWSAAFDAQTEGRKEFGLRVTMDGNYKRAVK